MLLRQGVFLLSMLCLNDRMFVEHRAEVEHQYVNVVSGVTRLYKQIVGVISEAEGNENTVRKVIEILINVCKTKRFVN